MIRKLFNSLLVIAGLAAAGFYFAGGKLAMLPSRDKPAAAAPASADAAIAVTVATVRPGDFVDTVMLTGTLVARDEILVGPEIEGLRVQELLVDEGDRVVKGQPLARLTTDSLEAQLAQNDAALARAEAAIAQAGSQISQSEARVDEAKSALDRSRPLRTSGVISESVFEARDATFKAAQAQLAASREALKVAEAERGQVKAQRREIEWRRGNAEVKSPADGIVSRRTARVGAMALAAAEPMFRILARGEIELEAEVPETQLYKIKAGQTVRLSAPGMDEIEGKVRLVSPEVDRATRLGRVRVFLGAQPGLRVGSFARATLEAGRSHGLAVPSSAILFTPGGSYVQVVRDGKVVSVPTKPGLVTGAMTEIVSGLREGDQVVAKSGTFLREGDAVRPVRGEQSAHTGAGETRLVSTGIAGSR